MVLTNWSIYYPQKNVKSEYNNNKFKTSAPAWNYAFDLPDGSYSFSDVQDYFEFITKKLSSTHQFKFTQIKSKTELFSKQKQVIN